jgi:hypothetical protein
MLKIIELRKNYAHRHADERSELFREYLAASRDYRRSPEDYTDEFRETLEAVGWSFNRSVL